MKLIKIFITVMLLQISAVATAQSFQNASEYLDFVGKEQKNITQSMWNYTKAVAHSKSDRTVDSRRKVLVKTVERTIAKVERAQGFDGDEYKNQILEHLNFNLNLLNEDYAKIIDMKEVAEQSYDLMEAYMLAQELADKKMEESQKMYETNFYAFANKHHISIIEDESDLGKKMAISNDVFKHYKKMYLTYFKVYINEVYLMAALEKSDIGAIEQSANALSDSAKEGMEILSTLEVYKNDQSLIAATKAAFEFFIDEADNKVPDLTGFLLLNENFESIKKALESTPERKRTKEQVDEYNKKVNELNNGVKNYNKTNTDLNKDRQIAINKLNTANETFLARHIPND